MRLLLQTNFWAGPECILRVIMSVSTVAFMTLMGIDFGALTSAVSILLFVYSIEPFFKLGGYKDEDYEDWSTEELNDEILDIKEELKRRKAR